MKPRWIARMMLCALMLPAVAAAGTLQRFTLIVGANSGGQDRVRLKYAVTDAERVARVMAELGGVPVENEVILKEPHVENLLAALDTLKTRLAQLKRAPDDRTELFFYYSGHADEQGLLLGDDRLSYQSLRDRLDAMPADLRIAVLDACASGAFTRMKGGKRLPPLVIDQSTRMRGHAFITSSAETEAAQESDRIRSSFFTHYLVSGFRGAADTSGDGRVTLNEAYQFAFAETLGRTVNTTAGAQHPSYDINLSGAGDVVMTDVRQTTARLVLPEELEGRFFVRDNAGLLVAELYKPRGRVVEIAVEPGKYDIRMERDRGAMMLRADAADGARVVLAAQQFTSAGVERAVRRGDELGQYSLLGRNRVTIQSGLWGSHGGVQVQGHNFDFASGLQYARYMRENLAVAVSMTGFGVESQIDLIGGYAIPITLQWNPRRGELSSQRLKPFLSSGVVAVSSGDSYTPRRVTMGVHVGSGADYQVSHTVALGVSAGWNIVSERLTPSNLYDNFGGPELAVRIGWLFGSRH